MSSSNSDEIELYSDFIKHDKDKKRSNNNNGTDNREENSDENSKLMEHETKLSFPLGFLIVQLPREGCNIDKLFDDNKPADYVLVYNDVDDDGVDGLEINDISHNDLDFQNNDHNRLTSNDKRKIYLRNLIAEGLELKYFKKSDGKRQNVYVFVHTPDDKLCEAAEKTRFKVKTEDCKIESSNIVERLYDYCWNKLTNPFKLPNGLCDERQRDYITVPFTSKLRAKIEKFNEKPFGKMLSRKDRSLLTHEFLSQVSFSKLTTIAAAGDSADLKIGIERLLDSGIFSAAYPLHEDLQELTSVGKENLRQILWKYWAKPSNIFNFQPLHHVREYFGEKVAFYFAWLGFYTSWLFIPSIIGILVFIYGVATLPYDIPTLEICDKNGIGNLTMCKLCGDQDACKNWQLHESCLYSRITHIFDNPATVFFSVAMAIWTVLFIEFWKRRQSELQYEWDVVDFEDKYDTVRPDYERKVTRRKKNPVTQKMEPYVPFRQKFTKYLTSISAVLFMISLVIALLFSVILYRVTVLVSLSKKRWDRTYSNYFVSITAASINLIFILILNRFYTRLAILLTKIELHRTDSSYEKSFTVKMYLFQFVNFYSSIFYVAFFKGRKKNTPQEYMIASKEEWYYEPCDPSGCLVELCIQLATIMIGKQIINNIQEFFYPAILNCISKKTQVKSKRTEVYQWEEDYSLMSWTNMSLFDEYLEMVIQYGFITLFVVAFPLGPIFAFINNILEIRIDSYKFLIQSKRPLAKRAQSIGIWLNILNTVSAIGVITNGLIIAFTSEFIPRLVYQISANKPDLSGYMNYTLLEYNYTETEVCMYRGYEATDTYHILVGRLAFIVCFEHLTFFLVTVLHWIIPDVPTIIKDKIENENSMAQRIIWQTNSETNLFKTRHRSTSYSQQNDNANGLRPDSIIVNNIHKSST